MNATCQADNKFQKKRQRRYLFQANGRKGVRGNSAVRKVSGFARTRLPSRQRGWLAALARQTADAAAESFSIAEARKNRGKPAPLQRIHHLLTSKWCGC